MSDRGGVWRLLLTAENRLPPIIEQDIRALNRLELKARAVSGQLAAVAGKGLAGAGLGAMAGMGGGIGTGLAAGAAYAAADAMKQMVTSAREMDASADKTAAALKEVGRYTDSTVSALSTFGTALEGIKRIAGRFGAETFAQNVNFGRLVVGSAVGSAAGSLASLLGKKAPSWLVKLGAIADDQGAAGLAGLPKWFGGMNDDLGTQAAARAEVQLKASLERKRKRVRSADAAGMQGAIPAVDELARIGLFRGGGGTPPILGILEKHTTQLELLNRNIRDLAPRIAEHL